MKLNLKRPIAFFDLETTGLNITHDRIVEVSVLRINVNGDEEQRGHADEDITAAELLVLFLFFQPGLFPGIESAFRHGLLPFHKNAIKMTTVRIL